MGTIGSQSRGRIGQMTKVFYHINKFDGIFENPFSIFSGILSDSYKFVGAYLLESGMVWKHGYEDGAEYWMTEDNAGNVICLSIVS
jgi:hypothetical protein